jgi:hypothetical protein
MKYSGAGGGGESRSKKSRDTVSLRVEAGGQVSDGGRPVVGDHAEYPASEWRLRSHERWYSLEPGRYWRTARGHFSLTSF